MSQSDLPVVLAALRLLPSSPPLRTERLIARFEAVLRGDCADPAACARCPVQCRGEFGQFAPRFAN